MELKGIIMKQFSGSIRAIVAGVGVFLLTSFFYSFAISPTEHNEKEENTGCEIFPSQIEEHTKTYKKVNCSIEVGSYVYFFE